jgi:pilus assembly protein Flp/PilA
MWTDLLLRSREALRGLLQHDGEDGQGMVEYAFILILVAMVVIVVLTTLGNRVNNMYSNVSSGLGT